MPFVVFIFFVIFFILICPIKVIIKYNTSEKDENLESLNCIKIYVMYFLKVKTIHLKNNFEGKRYKKVIEFFKYNIKNYNKTERKLKLLTGSNILKKFNDSIRYKRINLEFGFNLKDYILNAYLLTFITAVSNMYVSSNIEKFDINNINLDIYINQKSNFKLKLFGIIELSFVNTIIIVINILFRKIKRRTKEWITSNILLKT